MRHTICGSSRIRGAATAITIACTASLGTAWAAGDGSFPTADEVGGEVFPAGLQPGDVFPMDTVVLYDSNGQETTLDAVAKGKRTLVTFFISAAPVSVQELAKIEDFAESVDDLNVIFANADFVGTGLFGGADAAIPETVRTVNIIKIEENLDTPMYVAPNDFYSADGLSNRLGFRGLPTSYILDAEGKVIRTVVGQHDWSADDLELAAADIAATDGTASNTEEGE